MYLFSFNIYSDIINMDWNVVKMINIETFNKIYEKIKGEPEFSIYINNSQYMIIKYRDYVTFQRCGINDRSGEIKYNTLEELYNSTTIDKICLKKDWHKIKDIVIDEIYSVKNDLEEIKEIYKIG